MKAYTVEYKMHPADKLKFVTVLAKSKEDAWEKATYEAIPEREGTMPYSSWTAAVTYQNGNYRQFNTFEGKPF